MVIMVVVACVSISTMLRVEWRLERREPRAEAAQHVFQHGVAPDAQRVAHHLHLGVAIADVPGEAGEGGWGCRRRPGQRAPPPGPPRHGAGPRPAPLPRFPRGRLRGVAPLCTILFLEMPPRVFSTATSCFSTPSLLRKPRLSAAFDTNTTEDATSALPKAPNIGR